MSDVLRSMVANSQEIEILGYLNIFKFMSKKLIQIANNATSALQSATVVLQRYAIIF